jgi:polyphenol oxidase
MAKDLLLYAMPLGHHARVAVTRCDFDWPALRTSTVSSTPIYSPYFGNLALHVNDTAAHVIERRLALDLQLGRPVQWLNQVHGTQVVSIQKLLPNAPTADASVTQSKSLALGVLTADCLPVCFATRDKGAIAIAHAGWRGLLNGVLDATWKSLREHEPIAPIHTHLGPCIGLAQFEVGEEVFAAFMDQNAAAARHFTACSHGKYLCDLTGLARQRLMALGACVITGGGWCTVSDYRLASYRRSARLQQASARFATVITLNDE